MITPSSVANLVECVYRVDVECDVAMAADPEIQLPVQIYANPPMPPAEYTQAIEAFAVAQ